MYFIYYIRNTVNNKVYVGYTGQTVPKRWSDHRTELRGNYHLNKHLQSSFNKYGEKAFNIEEIEQLDTEQEAWDREIYHISLFMKSNMCYNKCLGGNRPPDGTGKKRSLDTILKMRESQKKVGRGSDYTYLSETKNLREWSRDKRCVVSYDTLRARLQRQKWEFEKALTTPMISAKGATYGAEQYTAFGDSKTLCQWIRDSRCRVYSLSTLKNRLNTFSDFEEALVTPVKDRKNAATRKI